VREVRDRRGKTRRKTQIHPGPPEAEGGKKGTANNKNAIKSMVVNCNKPRVGEYAGYKGHP